MISTVDKKWWEAASIRALKTVCQTAIATIGTAATIGQVNWKMVLSASLLSGILSLLTSLKGLPEVDMLNTIEKKEEFIQTVVDKEDNKSEEKAE